MTDITSTAPLGGAPREAEPQPTAAPSEETKPKFVFHTLDDRAMYELLRSENASLRQQLAAATARVGELCDALEIIEGDCLRNSEHPVTTLFHIYTTARAALRQEEPRE